MKPGIREVASAIACFLTLVSAVTITQNTVSISTYSVSLGDLTINAGVYYSLVNNVETLLTGKLDNEGGFYITAANGLAASVTMTGSSFLNAGTLAFNSLSASVISTYLISTSGTFTNTGSMYLGVSGATLSGTPFRVRSTSTWSNTGMMVFERSSGTSASVDIGSSLSSVTNAGSICLYNTDWSQTITIEGSGCITVGESSQLTLLITSYTLSTTQTIYLSSSDSVLIISGLVSSSSAYPTYIIAGFGGGNVININLSFTSYSYSSTTGILTIVNSIFRVYLNIGTGYTSSLFSTNTALTGKSITYSGSAPNSVPSICSCVWTFPDVTTTSLASTTSTSTSSTRSSSVRSSTITSSSSSTTKVSSSSSTQSPSVIISSSAPSSSSTISGSLATSRFSGFTNSSTSSSALSSS